MTDYRKQHHMTKKHTCKEKSVFLDFLLDTNEVQPSEANTEKQLPTTVKDLLHQIVSLGEKRIKLA